MCISGFELVLGNLINEYFYTSYFNTRAGKRRQDATVTASVDTPSGRRSCGTMCLDRRLEKQSFPHVLYDSRLVDSWMLTSTHLCGQIFCGPKIYINHRPSLVQGDHSTCAKPPVDFRT